MTHIYTYALKCDSRGFLGFYMDGLTVATAVVLLIGEVLGVQTPNDHTLCAINVKSQTIPLIPNTVLVAVSLALSIFLVTAWYATYCRSRSLCLKNMGLIHIARSEVICGSDYIVSVYLLGGIILY